MSLAYGGFAMQIPLPNPLRIVRRQPPASLVSVCPACARPVCEGDERVRLRGDAYAHRGCGTYAVRRVSALGGYRRRPGPAGRAAE